MSIKKIYVADDSAVTRMFIINIIKDLPNTSISEYSNGEDAIKAITKERPDLLILDSVMPVLDGLSVLKTLKDMHIQIPILFCTADIQSTTKEKATELGISEFINKPIQKEVILFNVKNLLNI